MTGGPESEWKINLGKEIQNSVVALSQTFIVVELLMYIILFRHVYCYNKELKNGKSLGLPDGGQLGLPVGLPVGEALGDPVGLSLGAGLFVGASDGALLGK